MAKEIVKNAAAQMVEKGLEQFFPNLMNRLDELQHEILELRREMHLGFDRTKEVINEVGLRLNTVATRMDTFSEFIHRDSVKVDTYLERLVRVEEALKSRKRRAS